MADSKNIERKQRRKINLSRKVRFAAGVILVILVLILTGFYVSFTSMTANAALQSSITPSPEVESGEALRSLRATEDAVLTTYGWADRDNGVVRVPIDRAMELLLQRGLPTRPENQRPAP